MLHALIWMAMHSSRWQYVKFNPPINIHFNLATYPSGYWELNLGMHTRAMIDVPGICWLQYGAANPQVIEPPF